MNPDEFPPDALPALAAAAGAWAIIRRGRAHLPPRARRFRDEASARVAWHHLDVRQGWAVLVDPAGTVRERQSGPSLRTRW